MLILIPRFSKSSVKALPVNCDPWSVLKISGFPFFSSSSSAYKQKSASSVFDNGCFFRIVTQQLGKFVQVLAFRTFSQCDINIYIVQTDWFSFAI
jgi:hypothetical protein